MAFSVAARAQTAAPVLGARKAAARPGKQQCRAPVETEQVAEGWQANLR